MGEEGRSFFGWEKADILPVKWTHNFGPGAKVDRRDSLGDKRSPVHEEYTDKALGSVQGKSGTCRCTGGRHRARSSKALWAARKEIYKWKKELVENADRVLAGVEARTDDGRVREADLLRKIGELTMERDFLSKGLGRLA